MKNGRPVNLFPLLVAIRHPIAHHKIEYEKRYCNAKKTMFCPWDTSGSSNLEELRVKVDTSILRKTKEECMKDLPVLHRTTIGIPVSASELSKYHEIISSSRKQKGGRGQRPMNKLHEGGELMNKLRQYCSLSKVFLYFVHLYFTLLHHSILS